MNHPILKDQELGCHQLEGIIVEHGLCLKFSITNNKAKYEALIIGLRITKKLGV